MSASSPPPGPPPGGSAPPPAGPPPDGSAPPPASSGSRPVVVDLAAPGGMKRLIGGRRGEHRLTFTPQEILVEDSGSLRAPLRFAPGSVVVASVDPGPAGASAGKGRFPILRRIGDKTIPREEGIEGWVWTSDDGSAFTVIGDAAPNLAFVFSPPLSGAVVEESFEPSELQELAKRSPLGQPAVFGLLVHAERLEPARQTLDRYALLGPITDREVPPVQRRHLPGDKPANPAISARGLERSKTSVPPPGMG